MEEVQGKRMEEGGIVKYDEWPIELIASRVWDGTKWHYPHIEGLLEENKSLRKQLAAAIKQRDEAQRKACWQYARRYGGGNPSAERKLAERHAEFNGWDCFKDYDWSKYE